MILLFAFRYALGRRTYSTSIVSEEIISKWNELSEEARRRIYSETCEAVKQDEAGDQCDIDNWNRVIRLGNKDFPTNDITLDELKEIIENDDRIAYVKDSHREGCTKEK